MSKFTVISLLLVTASPLVSGLSQGELDMVVNQYINSLGESQKGYIERSDPQRIIREYEHRDEDLFKVFFLINGPDSPTLWTTDENDLDENSVTISPPNETHMIAAHGLLMDKFAQLLDSCKTESEEGLQVCDYISTEMSKNSIRKVAVIMAMREMKENIRQLPEEIASLATLYQKEQDVMDLYNSIRDVDSSDDMFGTGDDNQEQIEHSLDENMKIVPVVTSDVISGIKQVDQETNSSPPVSPVTASGTTTEGKNQIGQTNQENPPVVVTDLTSQTSTVRKDNLGNNLGTPDNRSVTLTQVSNNPNDLESSKSTATEDLAKTLETAWEIGENAAKKVNTSLTQVKNIFGAVFGFRG